jgi:hypothetical protein
MRLGDLLRESLASKCIPGGLGSPDHGAFNQQSPGAKIDRFLWRPSIAFMACDVLRRRKQPLASRDARR